MRTHQLSILHIEDDHVDRMVVERVVKKLGITDHFYQAQHGEEALDMLRGSNGVSKPAVYPNIILADINMPRMNGLEFIKELRDDPELKPLSVFIITTSSDEEDIKEAYRLNVAGYVIKPVDIAEFENTFKTLSAFWHLCEQF